MLDDWQGIYMTITDVRHVTSKAVRESNLYKVGCYLSKFNDARNFSTRCWSPPLRQSLLFVDCIWQTNPFSNSTSSLSLHGARMHPTRMQFLAHSTLRIWQLFQGCRRRIMVLEFFCLMTHSTSKVIMAVANERHREKSMMILPIVCYTSI